MSRGEKGDVQEAGEETRAVGLGAEEQDKEKKESKWMLNL